MDFNDNRQAKMARDLLKCFPCLGTLDIVVVIKKPSLPWDLECREEYWEQQDSCYCLSLRLKRVNLKGCISKKTPVGFARFLIMRAQVLKVVSRPTLEGVKKPIRREDGQKLCIVLRLRTGPLQRLKLSLQKKETTSYQFGTQFLKALLVHLT